MLGSTLCGMSNTARRIDSCHLESSLDAVHVRTLVIAIPFTALNGMAVVSNAGAPLRHHQDKVYVSNPRGP